MKKEFIPYEQALALKELGFDEPCLAFKDFDHSLEIGDITKNSSWSSEIISIPLYQQAFRWFREKYKIWIQLFYSGDGKVSYNIHQNVDTVEKIVFIYDDEGFHTYEEAELECLKKLIEIVKSK